MKSPRYSSLITLLISAVAAHAAPLDIGTAIDVDFGPTAPTNDFNNVS